MDNIKPAKRDGEPSRIHVTLAYCQLAQVARPFETLTREGKKLATHNFRRLLGDVMGKFKDHMVSGYDEGCWDQVASVRLQVPAEEDASFLGFYMGVSSRGNDHKDRFIEVYSRAAGDYRRASCLYYTEGNSYVRRIDNPEKYSNATISVIDRDRENGVNDQPVSTEEIAALRQLIEAAEVNNAL